MSSGTKNSIGDFLRFVFSTLVNKDDEVFKALFANPDDESGVVETIFNQLEESRDEWCNNSDIYNQTGEMLDKSLSFFSVLERLYAETDESYKDRNALLFWRQGDELWGDKWDVLKIFKVYFGTDDVFIVNDTNDITENLLLDGDFEDQNAWTLHGCVYDSGARFSERFGVLFNSPGTCEQAVNVEADSTYFLHWFLKGSIGVQIKDNNGRYWKPAEGTREFGEWENDVVSITFNAAEWDASRCFFLTDEQISSVTISFIGQGTNIALLDYVRLFKKGNWSSFTLIANFMGLYTAETMAMAPGNADPVRRKNYSIYGHFSGEKHSNDMFIESGGTPLAPGEEDEDGANVNYGVMSYIEQANLFGTDIIRPESIYTELLEIVRAGGITSYIEITTRNSEN